MKAQVFVTLKREVLDPQGDAVKRALTTLGFAGVKDVRVGKVIDIELDSTDSPAVAQANLTLMGEKLLANAVIEDFRVEMK